MEPRKHERLPVESLVLPFLATRASDKQAFQYLLLDTSPEGAGIAIPSWALAREHLNPGERVNLHLPFRLHEKTMDQGEVRWARWRDDIQSLTCGVLLDGEAPAYYPVELSLEQAKVGIDLGQFASAGHLARRIFKDLCLLKRGLLIYLNHLAPYFSRVARVSRKDFKLLRDLLFDEVMVKTQLQYEGLQEIHQGFTQEGAEQERLASLDLEALRELVVSEMYLDLYENALDSQLASQHLQAIKTLEARLFYNYNTIVMLYLQSLTSS